MATLQSGVVPSSVSTETIFEVPAATSLQLYQPPPETRQSNYVKVIRSIGPGSVVDILPSVIEYLLDNGDKMERAELLQELSRKLRQETVMEELVKHGILGGILTQLIDVFSCDSSQTIQFELMSLMCSLPQSQLTEKLLSKLHSAALSSSPLIRRQSLVLVLRALTPNLAMKFLLAYLDDDDPRVRTTAVQHLVRAAEEGCTIQFTVYSKIISCLTDSYDEVRLYSVTLIPHLVRQFKNKKMKSVNDRQISISHHSFIQLCLLMRDISTQVRSETARVLGLFTDVDPEYMKQLLDKKVRQSMRILPAGTKSKQEYSSGRVWGGDAPIKSVQGEICIFDPGACGAFIHGMEDEYHDVRMNTVRSMCQLSVECAEFGMESMSHLVDMLNDEIQSVRLLAINSLQQISEHVHLHEDQLETVMSVLEERNVEIRSNLHKLISACKLNSQAAVRRVLRGLLDNLKKYPQDKSSIYKCVMGVGNNNSDFVALLAPEMLSKHPYLCQTEPSTDDTSYIATMILVLNAAKHNSVIFSFFHKYTPRHYIYIYSLLPELVPHLPQVHKILKSSGVDTDFNSITESLNSVVKQFMNLCKSGSSLAAMTKTTEDILKIQKCSSLIQPQTRYASLLLTILMKLRKLKQHERKRLSDGSHRVLTKIKDLVYDVCLFQSCFSGSPQIVLTGKLVKLYMIQFLRDHIAGSKVTDKDLDRYLDHVVAFSKSQSLELPSQVLGGGHFNLIHYFLNSPHPIISTAITQSTATILSPATNTDRVNEFPSHLSFSIQVEAETRNVEACDLAVQIRYPGSVDVVCQPAVECALVDYYQNTVFVGGSAWSHPGIIELTIVKRYEVEENDLSFHEIFGTESLWLELSEPVQMKVHPRLPK